MKNMKKIWVLLLSLMMVFSLAACGNKEPAEEPDNSDDFETIEDVDGEIYAEEDEDAVITKVQKEVSEFCGTWTTDSVNGAYLYDELVITLNDDGTWNGTITGEKLKGKWSEGKKCIKLTSDIFDCELAYTDTDKLVLIENIDGEDMVTVLKKN